jgi:hypothetical protein
MLGIEYYLHYTLVLVVLSGLLVLGFYHIMIKVEYFRRVTAAVDDNSSCKATVIEPEYFFLVHA